MKTPYEITHKILDLYGQITESLRICKSLLLVKPEAKLRRQNRIKTIKRTIIKHYQIQIILVHQLFLLNLCWK